MTKLFNYYPQMFIDECGRTLSGEDMSDVEKKIAAVIPSRSLIFCLCMNSLYSAAGYIAFINLKIVPLLLDAGLDKSLFDNLYNSYKPAYLYIPKNCEMVNSGELICEIGDYILVKTSFPGPELHNDLGLLLTTSGSTGSAKLVRLTYNNILANAESIIKYLNIKSDDRPITTLPMNYTYGLSIINSHILSKATILCTDYTIMQKEFWQFFKEFKATTFGGVPYTYEMLKKLRFLRMDLSNIRYLTQAGGKLSFELTKEFVEALQSKNIDFIVMYGQTEATARMSYLPREYALTKCGSIGIAIPGGRFELIDAEGNRINENNIDGELVYYGPNVSMGYAECAEDLIKNDELMGKLVTGDIARRDNDGYYYITGRKKRFIKIFGNRVNLDETERMLKTITTDVACAGRDDLMNIYITDKTLSEQIRKFVADKTGLNPLAFQIIVLKEIPKNEAGKTIYAKL